MARTPTRSVSSKKSCTGSCASSTRPSPRWRGNGSGKADRSARLRRKRLVRRLLGAALKGAAVDQGIGGEEPGSPAPYLAIGHLLFESPEAFQTAFGPHVQTIMADIPNYTNSEPTLQISEVKL